ncbi:MAG TPA: hypothetical protein VJM32_00270 [Candidatus Saccharimonadales bacterium]|nr:hypothetical protein [Candidatus Saccharimonadales bacterium]
MAAQTHPNTGVHYDVPFMPNGGKRCLEACVGMVLGYFMPGRHFSDGELDALCGLSHLDDTGSWSTKHMLGMADLGFRLQWIENFDYRRFTIEPEITFRESTSPKIFAWQKRFTNFPLEGERMAEYLARKLPWENRAATTQDIKRLLKDGWLARLKVNGPSLWEVSGYEGHSVVVVGYDATGVFVHNPDARLGNTPNQHVSWAVLQKAWEDYGGPLALQAYTLPSKSVQ